VKERGRRRERDAAEKKISEDPGRDVIGKVSPATKLFCDDIDWDSCAPEVWTARRRAL
jgi:hypothetical protein